VLYWGLLIFLLFSMNRNVEMERVLTAQLRTIFFFCRWHFGGWNPGDL
jgi:hypothetical protein